MSREALLDESSNSSSSSSNVARTGSTSVGSISTNSRSSSGLIHSGPLRTVLTPTSVGATIHGGIAPPLLTHLSKQQQQPKQSSTILNPTPIMKQQQPVVSEVVQLKSTAADPLLQTSTTTTATTTTINQYHDPTTIMKDPPPNDPKSHWKVAPPLTKTAASEVFASSNKVEISSAVPTPNFQNLYPPKTVAAAPSNTAPPHPRISTPFTTTIPPKVAPQPRTVSATSLPIPDITTNTRSASSSVVMHTARSTGSSASTSSITTSKVVTPPPPLSTTPLSALDQEINDFLLYDYNTYSRNGTDNNQSPPLLYPEPFPFVDIDDTNVDAMVFQKVLYFAYRRQWNYLIEASNAVFLVVKEEEVSSSAFDLWKIFQQLLRQDDNDDDDDDEANNNRTILLLSSHTSTTEQRLQREICIMLYLRFVGLVKLRKYNQLGHEIDRLYLIPSTNPTSSSSSIPSWVPIGLQIAAIQTLQYTDKPQRCIDTLHHFFNLISSSDVAKRWNIRIQLTLCNVFVREKEWRMALVSLEYVLRHLIDVVPIEVLHCVPQLQMDNNSRVNDDNDNIAQLLLVASRIEVLSRQGRILVQAGAMSEAEQMFHRIEEEDYVVFCTVKQRMLQQGQSELYQRIVNSQWFVQKVSTNVIINKGIILFAREQYAQAMDQYTLAIEEERYFNSKDATGYCHNMLHPGIGLDPPEEHSSYLPHCLNNLGLCALYSCRMHEAVVMLESLVRENPTLYLTETLTFNLCTLYELGSDNATSGRKKRILQLIAKRFSLHDIGTESFRIS